jgi:hypothetical protein
LGALEKRVEQQFLGDEIVGFGEDDRTEPDDRGVIVAGPRSSAPLELRF